MRVLIFGKNGQVAQELAATFADVGSFTTLGRDKCDLTIKGRATSAIADFAPDLIINAAAYTAVDRAESEKPLALRLNRDAPREIAFAAAAAGARFIHLSTDYVFDGAAQRPYRETDTPNPINFYGESKLAGENAVLAAAADAIILRLSWIFSRHGGNFVKSMLKLAIERDRLSIVADQTGGPTGAAAVAQTIRHIADKICRGAGGVGIYHFQGAPATNWAAFAREIFAQAGVEIAVEDIPTREYPTPARRPHFSVLDCARICADFGVAQPDWRDCLRTVIEQLQPTELLS